MSDNDEPEPRHVLVDGMIDALNEISNAAGKSFITNLPQIVFTNVRDTNKHLTSLYSWYRTQQNPMSERVRDTAIVFIDEYRKSLPEVETLKQKYRRFIEKVIYQAPDVLIYVTVTNRYNKDYTLFKNTINAYYDTIESKDVRMDNKGVDFLNLMEGQGRVHYMQRKVESAEKNLDPEIYNYMEQVKMYIMNMDVRSIKSVIENHIPSAELISYKFITVDPDKNVFKTNTTKDFVNNRFNAANFTRGNIDTCGTCGRSEQEDEGHVCTYVGRNAIHDIFSFNIHFMDVKPYTNPLHIALNRTVNITSGTVLANVFCWTEYMRRRDNKLVLHDIIEDPWLSKNLSQSLGVCHECAEAKYHAVIKKEGRGAGNLQINVKNNTVLMFTAKEWYILTNEYRRNSMRYFKRLALDFVINVVSKGIPVPPSRAYVIVKDGLLSPTAQRVMSIYHNKIEALEEDMSTSSSNTKGPLKSKAASTKNASKRVNEIMNPILESFGGKKGIIRSQASTHATNSTRLVATPQTSDSLINSVTIPLSIASRLVVELPMDSRYISNLEQGRVAYVRSKDQVILNSHVPPDVVVVTEDLDESVIKSGDMDIFSISASIDYGNVDVTELSLKKRTFQTNFGSNMDTNITSYGATLSVTTMAGLDNPDESSEASDDDGPHDYIYVFKDGELIRCLVHRDPVLKPHGGFMVLNISPDMVATVMQVPIISLQEGNLDYDGDSANLLVPVNQNIQKHKDESIFDNPSLSMSTPGTFGFTSSGMASIRALRQLIDEDEAKYGPIEGFAERLRRSGMSGDEVAEAIADRSYTIPYLGDPFQSETYASIGEFAVRHNLHHESSMYKKGSKSIFHKAALRDYDTGKKTYQALITSVIRALDRWTYFNLGATTIKPDFYTTSHKYVEAPDVMKIHDTFSAQHTVVEHNGVGVIVEEYTPTKVLYHETYARRIYRFDAYTKDMHTIPGFNIHNMTHAEILIANIMYRFPRVPAYPLSITIHLKKKAEMIASYNGVGFISYEDDLNKYPILSPDIGPIKGHVLSLGHIGLLLHAYFDRHTGYDFVPIELITSFSARKSRMSISSVGSFIKMIATNSRIRRVIEQSDIGSTMRVTEYNSGISLGFYVVKK
tara:strand:+ start:1813 stop:5178 length:3366 start_codon:yes stop_codon:yes gene_type:complete